MNLEKYQELLQNKAAYPIGKDGRLCILSPNEHMLIEIYYIPIETYIELYKDFDSRILFFVYPVSDKNDYPNAVRASTSNPIIIADFDSEHTALSYTLLIDEKNETVSMRLKDFPEHGKIFISENELVGITKKLWKATGVSHRMSQLPNSDMTFTAGGV